jgi:hypothetical protein
MDGNGGDAGERAVLGLMETCEMGKVGRWGELPLENGEFEIF